MYAKNAAITIISKNYFSYAQTLAKSYKKHHPTNDFIIILVDRREEIIPNKTSCGAEVIEVESLAIPDIDRLIYRYSIMELNTAIKPFALSWALGEREYQTVMYIDPDILIFRPLKEVYDTLESSSIILTPHILQPYYDNKHPSDISILQSGTYNLGFIALKYGATTSKFLNWWKQKLFLDCVVDKNRGLFVDQKWIDLVPGFFSDCKILRDPTYNVAYWNLHERRISRNGENWLVNDKVLTFFHFSGYQPYLPYALSKHQNRIKLVEQPELRSLTDAYAHELFANNYDVSSAYTYSFSKLSNGVKLPTDLVRDVMQWASHNGVLTPSPLKDANKFCEFLMSKRIIPKPHGSVLLYHFLLKRRPDVSQAYPAAASNTDDPGFRKWIQSNGIKEEGVGDLIPFEDPTEVTDYVADAFNRLKRACRDDVFEKYRNKWTDDRVFDEFADWFILCGTEEMNFSWEHSIKLKESKSSLVRILNIYFLRGDLQVSFMGNLNHEKGFSSWLRINRWELGLTAEDISLFEEFCLDNSSMLASMIFLYTHYGKKRQDTPNIYCIDERRYALSMTVSTNVLAEWLFNEKLVHPIDHYRSAFGYSEIGSDYRYIDTLSERQNFLLKRKIEVSLQNETDGILVNFAGYLNAPTGMGESARSMKRTLECANLAFRECHIPHPRANAPLSDICATMFGWPSAEANISLVVANPDVSDTLQNILPPLFWTPQKIGYWVWETEIAPPSFMAASQGFDEIWTPSEYSASAIRLSVEIPVNVLPHALNLTELDKATRSPRHFNLPDEGILFGFFFDPDSSIQRKNVSGLIKCFRNSFRNDDNCYLILKVNGRSALSYEYQELLSNSLDERIIFIDSTYDVATTYNLMMCLDVYVSLHRSEGFGLSCAEAMALGIPVVASNYSGNLEYMNHNNSFLVPIDIIQTDRPYGAYPAGTVWCEPNIEAAEQIMRNTLKSEKRRHTGKVGSDSVRNQLSPQKISLTAIELIKGMKRNMINGYLT